ncbi:hypothetical protein D3C77_361070 [compost metagenome]
MVSSKNDWLSQRTVPASSGSPIMKRSASRMARFKASDTLPAIVPSTLLSELYRMRTASAVSAPPAFWTMRAPIMSICSSLSLSSVRASWLSVAWTRIAEPLLPRL